MKILYRIGHRRHFYVQCCFQDQSFGSMKHNFLLLYNHLSIYKKQTHAVNMIATHIYGSYSFFRLITHVWFCFCSQRGQRYVLAKAFLPHQAHLFLLSQKCTGLNFRLCKLHLSHAARMMYCYWLAVNIISLWLVDSISHRCITCSRNLAVCYLRNVSTWYVVAYFHLASSMCLPLLQFQ